MIFNLISQGYSLSEFCQIHSRNFDPVKNIGFVCGTYFPIITFNEIFENLLFGSPSHDFKFIVPECFFD